LQYSTEAHCGFNIPWSPTKVLLFGCDSSYHDYHHSKNIGNYCDNIYLWDYFNGSSGSYFHYYGVNIGDEENKAKIDSKSDSNNDSKNDSKNDIKNGVKSDSKVEAKVDVKTE
jgi:sterol desaturase/sphingolipid hydroxylase (fatty acid hydroxylase superfamily)